MILLLFIFLDLYTFPSSDIKSNPGSINTEGGTLCNDSAASGMTGIVKQTPFNIRKCLRPIMHFLGVSRWYEFVIS